MALVTAKRIRELTTAAALAGGHYLEIDQGADPSDKVSLTTLHTFFATLDDYEEGTFTPALTAVTTPPTGVAYTIQTGIYVRNRAMVFIPYCRVTLSSKGSSGVGIVRLTGLPFATTGVGTSTPNRFSSATLPSSATTCSWLTVNGSAVLNLQASVNTGTVDVNWSDITGTFDVIFSIFYKK